jgi:hypothetical protein
MEPEGLLPCSQELATGLYSQPGETSPHPSHPISFKSKQEMMQNVSSKPSNSAG